eukprot:scaffold87367_cov52-Attheya_sp.AAC.1
MLLLSLRMLSHAEKRQRHKVQVKKDILWNRHKDNPGRSYTQVKTEIGTLQPPFIQPDSSKHVGAHPIEPYYTWDVWYLVVLGHAAFSMSYSWVTPLPPYPSSGQLNDFLENSDH